MGKKGATSSLDVYRKAYACHRDGRFRAAAALYQAAMRRRSGFRSRWRMLLGLGECLIAMGEIEAALGRFRSLAEIAPSAEIRLLALFRQAHCLDLLQREGDATPHLECLFEALKARNAGKP